jgi:alanine racemase
MNHHFHGKNVNYTYAEINLKTLKLNLAAIREEAGKAGSPQGIKICSVIKSNAYGHGMNETAKALADFGSEYLGTADYRESLILSDFLNKHSKKKAKILCLGILTEEKKFFDEVVTRNIEASIADVGIAGMLNDYAGSVNRKATVQIQIETGMNRIGFPLSIAYEAVEAISKMKNLNVKGIYSHYATSEIANNAFAKKQLKEFKSLVKSLESNVMKFELRHISNTGGILNYKDPYFNMVRPGISLYGYYPDRKKVVKDISIKPVMTLRSRVNFVNNVPKRQSISYGRLHFTEKPVRIVSIPIGYGDGYSRLLTNKSKVLINGRLYNTVGAVCMDWVMADVGNRHEVKVNDEVILFGEDYPAYRLSEITGSIVYEVICNVSSRVQRVYTY